MFCSYLELVTSVRAEDLHAKRPWPLLSLEVGLLEVGPVLTKSRFVGSGSR